MIMEEKKTLLEVKDLHTYFYLEQGVSKALHGVSFDIKEGETLGVVGESGCGKSMTALSIMRQIPDPPGRIVSGEILLHGEDLLKKSKSEMRKLRGSELAMIFQEPMTSLNPVMTIGSQIAETIRIHEKVTKPQAMEKAINMLRLVRIPLAEQRYHEYPHQLSGGMRQRVMIAMALSGDPELLIADEPTTALDVTIQAQILQLLKDLQEKLHMSIIIITHDLGVIAEMADEVAVMYAGDIVEKAPTRALFDDPKHPYTIGLMNSIPDINDHVSRLRTLEGLVPSLYDMPSGCRFAPRCQFCCPECEAHRINLTTLPDGRQVRCRRFEA